MPGGWLDIIRRKKSAAVEPIDDSKVNDEIRFQVSDGVAATKQPILFIALNVAIHTMADIADGEKVTDEQKIEGEQARSYLVSLRIAVQNIGELTFLGYLHENPKDIQRQTLNDNAQHPHTDITIGKLLSNMDSELEKIEQVFANINDEMLKNDGFIKKNGMTTDDSWQAWEDLVTKLLPIRQAVIDVLENDRLEKASQGASR